MNKKKIILGIMFFIVGFIIQIISVNLYSTVNQKVFYILSFLSTIPLSASVYIFAKMIPKKLNIIKYILYFYAFGLTSMFALVCILTLTNTIQETQHTRGRFSCVKQNFNERSVFPTALFIRAFRRGNKPPVLPGDKNLNDFFNIACCYLSYFMVK